MSDVRPSVTIRMSQDLMEEIRAVARQSGRSMNAEIVHRLDWTLSQQEMHRQRLEEAEATGEFDFLKSDPDMIAAKEVVMNHARQAMRQLTDREIVILLAERMSEGEG